MIQKLTPEDNQDNDNATHKEIRAAAQETIDTTEDKGLSVQEVKNVVASMRGKKAPGEDGIPSEVYKGLYGNSTPILNSNLQQMSKDRNLPKEVEKSSNNTDNKTRARR